METMGTSSHAPIKLLALFLVLAGLPLATLGWLGWRLLDQDRALAGEAMEFGDAHAEAAAIYRSLTATQNGPQRPGTDAAHQFTYKQIVISNLTGTGNDLLAFQGFNFSGNDRFDLVDVQATPEPSTIYTGFVSLAFLYARQRNRRILLFHNR